MHEATRVLVTGASGLLGRTVAQTLLQRGHVVTVMQRRPSGLDCAEVLGDIRDEGAVRQAVADQDAVIHLAARVSPTGSWRDFWDVNVRATRSLVTHSQGEGLSRFIYVSSPAVASSGAAHVGAPALAADPATTGSRYARSKAHAEQFVLSHSETGGGRSPMAVAAVRPHLVWGPGDEQLVSRIVSRAKSGSLRVIGSGAALVDSTYVDNAADAIALSMERAETINGMALVVSNGEPRPVVELLGGLCQAAGIEPPSRSVPPWVAKTAGAAIDAVWTVARLNADPPMTRFLAEQLSTAHWYDQRETRSLLEWAPVVSIDEGLDRLRDWYQTSQIS